MLDVVTERDLIADLRRLLADGLVEVDQETQIIGGPDADAPRITLTALGKLHCENAISESDRS